MSARRITVAASELLGVAGTGGPGTGDSLLSVALARRGHDVELLVAPGRDVRSVSAEWQQTYTDANVRVRPLTERVRVAPDFLAASAHVYDALKDDPPDVVVADDWRALPHVALRARQCGRSLVDTAFILYCHGPARVFATAARKVPDTVARFGEEVAQRACFELADAVVSPSRWLIKWMEQHGWPENGDVRVIQNLWRSVALGEPAERQNPGSVIRRLAFFGQIREGKGVRVFLTSLQRLDPTLLDGVELLFLGHSRGWTQAQVEQEVGRPVRLETQLDRTGAIRELLVPGTLAVMPSLLENSPYAVAECLEHGVPFIAADVGGTPELVAERDHARVLAPPTPEAFAEALARALTEGVQPTRPARDPQQSLEAWLDLVEKVEPAPRDGTAVTSVAIVTRGDESARRAARVGERTQSVSIDADADWTLVLDDDDVPDDDVIDALVAAQAASGADAVTTAVRPADDAVQLQLFLGDPGPLGLVENQYGVMGLVRSSLVTDDSDWPLFARIALAGNKIVSLPEPLALYLGQARNADALAVLELFEDAPAEALEQLPHLTATLARGQATREPASVRPGRLTRRLRVLAQRFARKRVESFADVSDPRPPLNVLHIGKTGGTALKHVLAESEPASRYQLLFRGHDVTLADIPNGEQFMFLIRDPLTRFVSAFNGRLREDRPRYHYPWREEERVAFAIFKTPDQLAVALSSEDEEERAAAERAMHGIGHVNTPYTFWFPDEDAFQARLADVFFIGLQDRLDEDFELLKRKLGLPTDATLPRDETVAHKTPAGYQGQLSDIGRANLERWYARDIAFVQLCRELAPRVNQA
jgi:glycosyltransferase involved in cell wall biosynthesis